MLDDKLTDSTNETQRFIGTHDGHFHCDEVFACWMLRTLPEFAAHRILRTRKAEVLEKCEIVVDVGAKFDPRTKRFDHHQKEFNETMRSLGGRRKADGFGDSLPFDTRLSSAGLVYAFYGKRVLRRVLEQDGQAAVSEDTLALYFERMYRNFIEAVDAVDNGIKQHADEPRYATPVSLQSLVKELNPAWNEEAREPDVQFSKAMALVGEIFTRHLLRLHTSWMPCRKIVEEGIKRRKEVHSSGRILLLEQSCPWKQHFFGLEREESIQNELIYAVYPSKDDWRVRAIPVAETSDFDNRCPFPTDWRGVRDAKLVELIGIPTASFVHQAGFIGAAGTRDDAVRMAAKSLEINRLLD
ncbi:hypothetical protein M3Y99_01440400 [Aphelenchoides fujianensis]|nr:hypothetical protein M3Y99_01440400 [Aphelenchoides fujianensis]